MTAVQVLITRVDSSVPMPTYAKGGDAGADISTRIDFTLAPGERQLIPTGISIALPSGYVALVHPRSGLALRDGITLVNSPGMQVIEVRFRVCSLITIPLNLSHSKKVIASHSW